MNKRSNNGKPVFPSGFQKVRRSGFSHFRKHECGGILALLAMIFLPTTSPAGTSTNVDISELPIEQLLNMEVTILRGHELLSQAPAAISVVTADDIRRSGAQSIPEALRQVPGMDVARQDPSTWGVSTRGFND